MWCGPAEPAGLSVEASAGNLPVGWPIRPAGCHMRPRIVIALKNFYSEPTQHIREVKLSASGEGCGAHDDFVHFPSIMCLSLRQGEGCWGTNWGSRKRDSSPLSPLCMHSDVHEEALTLFTVLNKHHFSCVPEWQDCHFFAGAPQNAA